MNTKKGGIRLQRQREINWNKNNTKTFIETLKRCKNLEALEMSGDDRPRGRGRSGYDDGPSTSSGGNIFSVL